MSDDHKKGKNLEWKDLSNTQRASVEALGFNQRTWNEGINTETMTFNSLNNNNRINNENLKTRLGNAARILGYEQNEEFPVLLSSARMFKKKKNLKNNGNNGNNRNNNSEKVRKSQSTNANKPNGNKPNGNKPKPNEPNKPNKPTYQHINSSYNKKKQMKGGKKSTSKKPKKIRKHKGIYQTGSKKGKLKPGYKYSGKKTQTGLKIIVKMKK